MQEESYTSKASFWDKDGIPVYKSDDIEKYHFSGKRINRGQYRTASGQVLNADVNGALNILRKSSVVDVNILYSRGEVDTQHEYRVLSRGSSQIKKCHTPVDMTYKRLPVAQKKNLIMRFLLSYYLEELIFL